MDLLSFSNSLLFFLSLYSFLPLIHSLVDCTHGFVGRMQASLNDDYIYVNDTRMCAADWCIKVLIHSGFDDDNTFQQGISSRCGYTGGDRQMCQLAHPCTQIAFYDGMRGNFSFCCCRDSECNLPIPNELDSIYGTSKKRVRSNGYGGTDYKLLFFYFMFLTTAFQRI